MPLRDDNAFTIVEKDVWVLLLDGEGMITNVSLPDYDIDIRVDITIPALTDKARVLKGSYENNTYINNDETVKLYGKARSKTVKLLITRMV